VVEQSSQQQPRRRRVVDNQNAGRGHEEPSPLARCRCLILLDEFPFGVVRPGVLLRRAAEHQPEDDRKNDSLNQISVVGDLDWAAFECFDRSIELPPIGF